MCDGSYRDNRRQTGSAERVRTYVCALCVRDEKHDDGFPERDRPHKCTANRNNDDLCVLLPLLPGHRRAPIPSYEYRDGTENGLIKYCARKNPTRFPRVGVIACALPRTKCYDPFAGSTQSADDNDDERSVRNVHAPIVLAQCTCCGVFNREMLPSEQTLRLVVSYGRVGNRSHCCVGTLCR